MLLSLQQGLRHMARTEGVRGMMKGNWTNCVRIIPNSAMKFFTYEQLSRWALDSWTAPTTGGGKDRQRLYMARGCLQWPSAWACNNIHKVHKFRHRAWALHMLCAVTMGACVLTLLWGMDMCCGRLISDHQLETTGSRELTPVLRLMAGAGAGIVAM
jgi:hypothetical protein